MKHTNLFRRGAALLLSLALLLTVLAGCEIHMAHEVFDYDYNPFLKRVELEKSGNGWEDGEDSIRFLVFTDAHIGRHDSKVTDRSGKVLEIAEDHDFVMSLGDLSDDGNISYGPLKVFLAAMGKKDVPFLGILGNHELQSDRMRDEWEALYHGNGLFGTLGCYTYGPLSIYALDSSLRIFTLAQLEALEQASKETGGVAFAMYPTSMDELLSVADAGRLMPPKSTWFEPKLRSGLFIHRF